MTDKLFEDSRDFAGEIINLARKQKTRPQVIIGAMPFIISAMLEERGLDIVEVRDFMDQLKSQILDMYGSGES